MMAASPTGAELEGVPDGWHIVLVEDIASITTGDKNTQDRTSDGRYPFFVRSQTVERINSYSFDAEATITAGDGVGTGKVFHYINGRFDAHQRVYVISNFVPEINGYLFHLCFSARFRDRIMRMTAKSSVDSVRREMIARMPMKLPRQRAEQDAIAETLSDTGALIEALEQLLAKKCQIKQGAVQELLRGLRRLPGFSGEWPMARVGALVVEGPTNGYSGPSSPDARGTPTLRLSATSSGRLVLNDETIKRLNETIEVSSNLYLEPGDLLVQRSNTVDLVGTAAVFDGPSKTFVYPDLMMRLRFADRSTGQWVWRHMSSAAGRRYFSSVAAGSTGSMPKISGYMVREMKIPLPEKDERDAIATILSDMDAEIDGLEARLAKARQIKQGMMQELLTGRTRLL